MGTKPEESARAAFEHLLLRQDPLASVILKGHLILEQLLTEFLGKRLFRNMDGVARADLRFAQLLDLCRAWLTHEEVVPLWDLIGKINTLRNDLGHSLETPKRRPLLNDIKHGYGLLVKGTSAAGLREDASDEDVLLATFALLTGTLIGITHPISSPPDIDAIMKDLLAHQTGA